MAQGLSFNQAKTRVREDSAPRCRNCGDKIQGTNDAYFCSKRKECKTAKRRYRYLKERYNLETNEALKQTLREVA